MRSHFYAAQDSEATAAHQGSALAGHRSRGLSSVHEAGHGNRLGYAERIRSCLDGGGGTFWTIDSKLEGHIGPDRTVTLQVGRAKQGALRRQNQVTEETRRITSHLAAGFAFDHGEHGGGCFT